MLSEKDIRKLLKKAKKDYKCRLRFSAQGILHFMFGIPCDMALKARIDTLNEVLERDA